MAIGKLIGVFVLVLSILCVGSAIAAPATEPSVSPDARQVLDQVRGAYSSLKSLEISGSIQGRFDIDGQKENRDGQFTGLFSDGKFRHEMKNDVLVGSTGDKVYLFQPSSNTYVLHDAPHPTNLSTIDSDFADVLKHQDLSLALAMTSDAAMELSDGATSIFRTDVHSGNDPLTVLQVAKADLDVTFAFDPQTHLLRRQIVDFTRQAKSRGAVNVRQATITTDYTNKIPPSVDATQFAWTPPAGSQELKLSASKGGRAPAFSLESLDGSHVSATDLKGTVYILDFWATWCGPCVASLPHLDQLYRDLKDQGLKVFAVNEQEDKAAVQKFITDNKYVLPVLLDSDGAAGSAYGADAIPETVVIDRNGHIRNIYVGAGHEDEIRADVKAALAEK